MALTSLRVTSLRCLEHVEIELDSRRNYLFGANGAGKTSVLESAYVLGRGRSFRTRQLRKLVRSGDAGFTVYGEVRDDSFGVRRLGVAIEQSGLVKRLDGAPAEMGQLARVFPVHAIDPGLHALIEGGPSERRRFLDWGVFHVEHGYLAEWRRYRRLLGQRNAALKTAGPAELRSWTIALGEAGVAVDRARRAYVSSLTGPTAATGEALLGQPIGLEYRSGWARDAALEAVLTANESVDRAAGTTTAGPHRADLRILIESRGVRDEASRGQQKLVAIALVVAQVAVHFDLTGTRVTVLVDDPAAELDRLRLERLLGTLDALPAQLVITTLGLEALPVPAGFPVFHVEQGRIRRV